VTARADLDDQLRPVRAGCEGRAARRAADRCEHELRVNLLQGNLLLRVGRTQSTTPAPRSKKNALRPSNIPGRHRPAALFRRTLRCRARRPAWRAPCSGRRR
jgi:hypothetical protein